MIVRYALENAPVRFSRPHRSMAATMRADYVDETSVARRSPRRDARLGVMIVTPDDGVIVTPDDGSGRIVVSMPIKRDHYKSTFLYVPLV